MSAFGGNPMGNFDFAKPMGKPKFQPKLPTPKIVPQVDDLFQVQRNALKVLGDIRALRDKHPNLDLGGLERDAENTYRVIRSWLDRNARPGGV